MDPLIKMSDQELGVAGPRMQYDHVTPGCNLCGRRNLGMLTPAYLAVRGHWALLADLGCEAFVLDSKLVVDFVQLPGGRKALILDVRFSRDTSVTVHEECAEKAVAKLGDLRACEDAWGDVAEWDPDAAVVPVKKGEDDDV